MVLLECCLLQQDRCSMINTEDQASLQLDYAAVLLAGTAVLVLHKGPICVMMLYPGNLCGIWV